LNETMTVHDLLECFDQLSYRRDAASHVLQLDDGVRRYLTSLLRKSYRVATSPTESGWRRSAYG
jgi:hypothetical protein